MQPPAPTLCFAHPPLRAPPASTASLTLSSAHPRLRPPSHPLLPPSDPLTLSSAPPTLRSAHRPPPLLRSLSRSAPLTLSTSSSAHTAPPLPRSPSRSFPPTLTLCSAHPTLGSLCASRSRGAGVAQWRRQHNVQLPAHSLSAIDGAHLQLRSPAAALHSPSAPLTLTLFSAHPRAPLNLTIRSQGQCWCTGRRGHAQVTTTCALL